MEIIAPFGPNSTKIRKHASSVGPQKGKNTKINQGEQNLDIIDHFGPNTTEICIHHLWAPRRVTIQKITKGGEIGNNILDSCQI